MSDTRYKIVYRHGIALDRWTAELWDKMVARFPGLILTQGVRSGAAASGGTHRGLGVLDLYLGRHASDWKAVLKYAFEIGFFGWYRPELWIGRTRVWKTHIHLGVRGNAHMAGSLKAQYVSWKNRRNGLRGNGADFFTWRPANYKKSAPYGPPAKPVQRWHTVAFLNTRGDDSGEGTRTFSTRVPRMATDTTAGNPSVVAYCEVRAGLQIAALTRSMKAKGYKLAAYSHRLALYVLNDVEVNGSNFSTYKQQNAGAVEGLLRVKLTVDGSRVHYGVTHLDYRKGFDKGRVKQIQQGISALGRWSLSAKLPGGKSRQVIVGDFNSESWVMDELEKNGFKDAGAGARIDFIAVGSTRQILKASKSSTNSDHPIIRATLGKK